MTIGDPERVYQVREKAVDTIVQRTAALNRTYQQPYHETLPTPPSGPASDISSLALGVPQPGILWFEGIKITLVEVDPAVDHTVVILIPAEFAVAERTVTLVFPAHAAVAQNVGTDTMTPSAFGLFTFNYTVNAPGLTETTGSFDVVVSDGFPT